MTLNEWRKTKNMDFVQLAKALDAPHSKVVARWCIPNQKNHVVIPSRRYMDRILKITMGAVQPNDFYLR